MNQMTIMTNPETNFIFFEHWTFLIKHQIFKSIAKISYMLVLVSFCLEHLKTKIYILEFLLWL